MLLIPLKSAVEMNALRQDASAAESSDQVPISPPGKMLEAIACVPTRKGKYSRPDIARGQEPARPGPGETATNVIEGVREAKAAGTARVGRADKVLEEMNAVRAALRRAIPGDLVVCCVDDAIGVYREAMSAAGTSRGGTAFADPGELNAPEGRRSTSVRAVRRVRAPARLPMLARRARSALIVQFLDGTAVVHSADFRGSSSTHRRMLSRESADPARRRRGCRRSVDRRSRRRNRQRGIERPTDDGRPGSVVGQGGELQVHDRRHRPTRFPRLPGLVQSGGRRSARRSRVEPEERLVWQVPHPGPVPPAL